ARTHPGLRRLLRHGLVGEDVDPHLSAAPDVTRDRDTGRLDLAVRDPCGLERDQAEVTEMHLGPALGATTPAAPMHLAVLDLLGSKHQPCFSFSCFSFSAGESWPSAGCACAASATLSASEGMTVSGSSAAPSAFIAGSTSATSAASRSSVMSAPVGGAPPGTRGGAPG